MYSFPLPKEFRNQVVQSTGDYAHANFPESKYAVDIICPAGTPVFASRAGKVVVVHDGFNEWGLDKKFAEKANLVLVQHEDKTLAEYVHLKSGSILVKQRDGVSAGQVIAKTGLSGCMSEPHLHFNVGKIENNKGRSIPFEFND